MNREALLAKCERVRKSIERGGETYWLQRLGADEHLSLQLELCDSQGNPLPNAMQLRRGKLLVRALVDESGQRLFADREEHLLANLEPALAIALDEEATALIGLTSVEEAEKN